MLSVYTVTEEYTVTEVTGYTVTGYTVTEESVNTVHSGGYAEIKSKCTWISLGGRSGHYCIFYLPR